MDFLLHGLDQYRAVLEHASDQDHIEFKHLNIKLANDLVGQLAEFAPCPMNQRRRNCLIPRFSCDENKRCGSRSQIIPAKRVIPNRFVLASAGMTEPRDAAAFVRNHHMGLRPSDIPPTK